MSLSGLDLSSAVRLLVALDSDMLLASCVLLLPLHMTRAAVSDGNHAPRAKDDQASERTSDIRKRNVLV